MAIAVPTGTGNVTTATALSAASLVGAKPTNTADGDILGAFFVSRNVNGTITAPSGWTEVKTDVVNMTTGFYIKPVASAASETVTSYTFATSSGAARTTLQVFRITGGDLSNPLDVAGAAAAAATGTSSVLLPGVTARYSGSLILGFATYNGSAGTQTLALPPGSMTEVSQIAAFTDSTTARSGAEIASQVLTAAGATDTRTFTFNPIASNSSGFLVALKAAPILQTIRPASDVTTTGWTATPSTGTFASTLDETTADDTDYVSSPQNPTNSVFEVKLGTLAEPADNLSHAIHVRARSQNASSSSMVVALMQGTTQIASFTQALTSTWTTYSFALSSTQAGNITDRTDLRARVTMTAAA